MKKRSHQHVCCHLVVYILMLNVLGSTQQSGGPLSSLASCVLFVLSSNNVGVLKSFAIYCSLFVLSPSLALINASNNLHTTDVKLTGLFHDPVFPF